MQSTDIPVAFPIPFGNSAGGSYIHQVPTASQIGVTDGAASLTDGFPPLTFQPVGSGGIPPFGNDMNGVLFQATAWCRWVASGGAVQYNSAFSTAVGGYPKFCVLASTTPGIFWQSTVENNTTNPDGGSPSGWQQVAAFKASSAEVIAGTNDTKFITPLGLASAFGAGSGESVTLPGGRIEKVGKVRTTISGPNTYSVTFGTAFPTAIQSVILTPVNATGSGSRDNWVQLVSESLTGFAYVVQSSDQVGDVTLNGIDWRATGY